MELMFVVMMMVAVVVVDLDVVDIYLTIVQYESVDLNMFAADLLNSYCNYCYEIVVVAVVVDDKM
jgi:hypothetical protein